MNVFDESDQSHQTDGTLRGQSDRDHIDQPEPSVILVDAFPEESVKRLPEHHCIIHYTDHNTGALMPTMHYGRGQDAVQPSDDHI